jgi:hypothetical protein
MVQEGPWEDKDPHANVRNPEVIDETPITYFSLEPDEPVISRFHAPISTMSATRFPKKNKGSVHHRAS